VSQAAAEICSDRSVGPPAISSRTCFADSVILTDDSLRDLDAARPDESDGDDAVVGAALALTSTDARHDGRIGGRGLLLYA
jgi:hypothetical protein